MSKFHIFLFGSRSHDGTYVWILTVLYCLSLKILCPSREKSRDSDYLYTYVWINNLAMLRDVLNLVNKLTWGKGKFNRSFVKG